MLSCEQPSLRTNSKLLPIAALPQPGMADLYLASWCHHQQIPMLAIARYAGWADFAQAALVRAQRPWGYAAINDAVEAASARARAEDPESPLPERLGACRA